VFDWDLLVAIGLVAIALIVFFLYQIGLLPKKSIPLVVGALLGGLGFVIFRERRQQALKGQLKEVQDRIKQRQTQIDQLKTQYQLTDEDVAKQRAQLQEQATALQKEILTLRANNATERKEIDQLTPEQVRERAGTLGLEGS
jgi:septal ring factor EnvC (AmiA/AmiB activator)